MVGPEKLEALRIRMAELGILEEHLVEHFVQGSGPGGQKVNKTASCVAIHYDFPGTETVPPTAFDIKCQRTRSLSLNRYYARFELCERLTETLAQEKSRRQQEAEKIRRQKRRRSRRQKAKMLADKRIHSAKKAGRRNVSPEE